MREREGKRKKERETNERGNIAIEFNNIQI